MPKTYRTVIRLGARSDTLDVDGRVTEVEQPRIPDEGEVRRAVASQVGEISQVPPDYSALKVQGRRAHDLARSGQAVDLAPRTVRIDRIELRRLLLAPPGARNRLWGRDLHPVDGTRRG